MGQEDMSEEEFRKLPPWKQEFILRRRYGSRKNDSVLFSFFCVGILLACGSLMLSYLFICLFIMSFAILCDNNAEISLMMTIVVFYSTNSNQTLFSTPFSRFRRKQQTLHNAEGTLL